MSTPAKDPVHAVKAWLHSGAPLHRSAAEAELATELRELEERLARAKKVELRVAPSEALEALLRPPGPVAL
jgi:hypothetical protein